MASTREERRLQRQRGAAKREVKNTSGFDLVLPGQDNAPLKPQRSSRSQKTPQPEAIPTPATKVLSSQKPPTKTPALRKLPARRSTRRTPVSADSTPNHALIQPHPSSEPVHDTSDQQPAPVTEMSGTIQERVKEEEDAEPSQSLTAPFFHIETPTVDPRLLENTEAGADVGNGSLKRKSEMSLTQASNKKPRISAVQEGSEHSESRKFDDENLVWEADEEIHESEEDTTDLGVGAISIGEEASMMDDGEDQSNWVSHYGGSVPESISALEETQKGSSSHLYHTEPKRKARKKRKSIAQRRPKRTSNASTKAPPARKSRKPAPAKSKPTTVPSQRDSSESKPSANSTTSQPSRRLPQSKASSSTVPISIYRPAPPPSPSVNSSPHPDQPQDPLTQPLPAAPQTINAIDVLAQISREVISKTASNPHLSHSSRRTIELYGTELDDRLRALGNALSTNIALGKRVKGLVAEERKVKKAIGEVKRERKGVGEKAEELRMKGNAKRVEGLVADIARAVRTGWEMEGVVF